MDPLVEELDVKLRKWDPEIADQVRQQMSEIISLADQGVLDLALGRAREQEVLEKTQRLELDKRLADAKANPGEGKSWSEVKARLLSSD